MSKRRKELQSSMKTKFLPLWRLTDELSKKKFNKLKK